MARRERKVSTTERLPGLIDAHVHLRTPGGTRKEDFATGTAAALAGGFTTVLDMPNTTPPTVDGPALESKMALARGQTRCDVGFFVGANNENVPEVNRLASRAVGLKMYLGQTYGPLLISQLGVALGHFRNWSGPGPVAVHAEGLLLAGAIALARATGCPVHCCHVSRREEIALIRAVKEQGAPVTCEVTPHHLFLTERDAAALGPLGFMKPILGTESDRQSLWDNLDVIDIIASDHAPHTQEEKAGEVPPPGVPGLETTLALMLTAVQEGRLQMSQVVKLLSRNPGLIFRIMPAANTSVEIDADVEWVLGDDPLHTRCGWTPFAGYKVRGKVRRVLLRGQTVFEDGEVLAVPGTGRVIEPLWDQSGAVIDADV
jgi:dihydroorotase